MSLTRTSADKSDNGQHFDPSLDQDFLNTGDLSFLEMVPHSVDTRSTTLSDLEIIVIGAGPAGLTFARAASAQGAKITVLERAGDPRSDDPGYSDRSFNVTIDKVGRYVIGDARAWRGGVRIVGRAVQNYQGTGKPYLAKYGTSPEAELISIPRPLLRQNLVNLALDEGADIRFHARVTDMDPDEGTVSYMDDASNTHAMSADLIVVTDGLHSISEKFLLGEHGVDYYLKPESRSCVTAMFYPEDNHNLSLNHIHFWHEFAADSCAIGIPNLDGSVAVLLISHFDDVGPEEHPFATPELAAERLRRDFPQLLAHNPQLAYHLPNRRKQRFYYKAVSSHLVGRRAVIAGDAGCAVPPWAGFGANSAMYSAASLAYRLLEYPGDLEKALHVYNTEQTILSKLKLDFVKDLGDFLSGPVTQSPEGHSDPALAPLLKQAQEETAALLATEQTTTLV